MISDGSVRFVYAGDGDDWLVVDPIGDSFLHDGDGHDWLESRDTADMGFYMKNASWFGLSKPVATSC